MMSFTDRPVVVVGAGIVGLCCAYFLRKEGKQVLLVDPSLPGTGCSFGNSGALSENSVTPIGMPGVLRQAPGMLLNSQSPLSVPLSYMHKAAPWLLSFLRSANEPNVTRTADVLSKFLAGSLDNHTQLMKEISALDLLRSGGQLHVYTSRRSLESDALTWRLRKERGLVCEALGRGEMQELEPALSDRYQAAMFLPQQSWLADPYEYCQRIFKALLTSGTHYLQAEVKQLQKVDGSWKVDVGAGTVVYAEDVIIAAGVASRRLLQPLGVKLPLISQRGYHVHSWSPNVKVNRIIALADRKAFVCPMGDSVRIAGTVEFQDPDKAPNDQRAAHLANHLADALKGVNVAHSTRWMGNRPCSPDSIPLIGTPPGLPGLWYATGHGHLGLTGAVNTGKLLCASIKQKKAVPDLAPLSFERLG
ncbi:FAD-dependent oxidoreductase [Pseudomonas putida]|uniref:FAD-dependent oxidoreductase n=1 Tax=Pseudomonas putida TaxID=303 RepID=A0A7D5VUW5_PSEPU|nr:FAD-dependent oxidoreductase [Pseudomonas putida]QLJ12593.1 FAD-dependent oxidoreductase [Pseudomonas putida]